MKQPRYQLTLHQLMVLVAFCALSFAMLATARGAGDRGDLDRAPRHRDRSGQGRRRGRGRDPGRRIRGRRVHLVLRLSHRRRAGAEFDPFLLIFPSLLFLPFGVIFGAVVNDLVRMVPGLLKRTRSSTDEGRIATGRHRLDIPRPRRSTLAGSGYSAHLVVSQLPSHAASHVPIHPLAAHRADRRLRRVLRIAPVLFLDHADRDGHRPARVRVRPGQGRIRASSARCWPASSCSYAPFSRSMRTSTSRARAASSSARVPGP